MGKIAAIRIPRPSAMAHSPSPPHDLRIFLRLLTPLTITSIYREVPVGGRAVPLIRGPMMDGRRPGGEMPGRLPFSVFLCRPARFWDRSPLLGEGEEAVRVLRRLL